jgi:hypothetical protein
MIDTINHRIPTLKATLGVDNAPGFKAVVYPSIRAATPSFPPFSQTATDQYIFAGFAQPEYRLFVQGRMNSSTFTHELAHLFTHEAVSSALAVGLPSWLGEGLARFLESGSSDRSNERLRSSVHPDELLSLRNMQTIPGQRSDVFIFYPQAGAFVGYLIEEYGHDMMASYLAAINSGQTLLGGFETVFGRSLYDVENDWRKLFGAAPLAVASATSEPDSSAENSATSTTVPLIDYDTVASQSSQPAKTATSTPPITVSPETLPPANDASIAEKTDPSLLVAGIVIGMSIIIGLWLFTSRRILPKPKA